MYACSEKCLRSDEVPEAEGIGGATDDPKDPTTGSALEVSTDEDVDDSPPSPNRCWMEWS